MNRRFSESLALLGACAALAACASAPPPRELLDARAAYGRAASGDAARLSPAALHDAKVALDNAERSYAGGSDTTLTRDKAYVAVRKAELAEVVASIELNTGDEAAAHGQVEAAKAQAGALAARGELAQAREQLATTTGKLLTAGQNVESEQTARRAAEKKAREALARLSIAGALAVRDEPRGTVITVPAGVLFASGSAELLPLAETKLVPVADVLSHEQDRRIVVEGHTDSPGSDASNVALSQRRAQVVRDFFVSRGVPSDHIAATGAGESRPVADNATTEGRADNRRLEIVIQPVDAR